MTPQRVVVVGQELSANSRMGDTLRRGGFRIETVPTIADLPIGDPDTAFVVFDRTLPYEIGEIARQIRDNNPRAGFAVVGSQRPAEDAVTYLLAGADYYTDSSDLESLLDWWNAYLRRPRPGREIVADAVQSALHNVVPSLHDHVVHSVSESIGRQSEMSSLPLMIKSAVSELPSESLTTGQSGHLSGRLGLPILEDAFNRSLVTGRGLSPGSMLHAREEASGAVPPPPVRRPRSRDRVPSRRPAPRQPQPRRQRAGKEGGHREEGEPPRLYWNTRFPRNADVLNPKSADYRRVKPGAVLLLYTAIEPQTAEDGETKTVNAQDVVGTKVVFELDGFGAGFALATGEQPTTKEKFSKFIRSEEMDCAADGTRTFRVWCRMEQTGVVRIEARLVLRNTKVLNQHIELDVGGTKARRALGRPAIPSPDPLRTPASTRALGGVGKSDLRLTVLQDGQTYGLRLADKFTKVEQGQAVQTAAAIDSATLLARKELVALARGYTLVAGGNSFELANPDDVLLQFAKSGAMLHEAIFGLPRDESVDKNLRMIASQIARLGRNGATRCDFQIDSPLVPVPWSVLYDAAYFYGSGPIAKQHPATAADVDVNCFWGRRFNIARTTTVTEIRGAELGNGEVRFQPVLNTSIALALAGQKKLLASQGPRTVSVNAPLNDPEGFLKWSHKGTESDFLYIFCHATTPELFNLQGQWTGGVYSLDDCQLGLAQFGGQRHDGTVSIEEIKRAWQKPRRRRPLVFLNACNSGQGSTVFGAPFVDQFVNSWKARAFVGTEWEVPIEFADGFSQIVVRGLREGLDIALALRQAIDAAFEVNNPFGLTYTLYGRGDTSFGPTTA